jgi:Domain of unknown function (DUF4338)/DDE_Tnp_1-associated/Transposase DDE domain
MGILSSQILVRPLRREEEKRFSSLMEARHYLGFNGVLGERIHYVAERDGKWVALLSWACAALKIRARDSWVGWSVKHRESRIQWIANNWRFLVLTEHKEPNLASCILAKNLRRLSADWVRKYAHPILMVETFVDAKLFRGTCYLADNWICLGESSGFRKGHEGYQYHGEKKRIFVKPLYPRARQVLGCPWTHPIFLSPPSRGRIMAKVDEITVFGSGGLFEFAQTLQDGRSKHGKRYRTPGMITLCILATLAGVKGFKGIYLWAGTLDQKTLELLKLWRRPSVSTVRRFLLSVPAEDFDRWVGQWISRQRPIVPGTALAIDGKALRGSHDGNQKATQLLSLVDHEDGTVLAQRKIDSKTNEIPVAQALLSEMNIKGTVITGDAIHTQDLTATIIAREKDAEYVFTVKGNQEKLQSQIQARFENRAFSP